MTDLKSSAEAAYAVALKSSGITSAVQNLLPHALVLQRIDGTRITIESTGLARVSSTPSRQCVGYIGGVPVMAAPTWGEVTGLPEPRDGTIYIVSAMVAKRSPGRADVFSPGTGPLDQAIRDDKGQIEAVTRLIQAPAHG